MSEVVKRTCNACGGSGRTTSDYSRCSTISDNLSEYRRGGQRCGICKGKGYTKERIYTEEEIKAAKLAGKVVKSSVISHINPFSIFDLFSGKDE